MRCRPASNQCSPVSPASASASSIRPRRLPRCPPRLRFPRAALEKRQMQLVALTGVFRQRLSKLGRAGVPIAELRARPGPGERSTSQIERETVLSAERD